MVALFVVLTIIICVVADSAVQWRKARKEVIVLEPSLDFASAYALEDVSAPDGIYLDDGHTWVEVTPSGTAHVGMDKFARNLIGRIDSVELPEMGKEVRHGERLFTIRQGERRADFTAPIDGTVMAVDRSLIRHPEAIESDPYHEGWVCSLSPKNLARNLKRLRVAEESRDWLKDEVSRFREFFAARPLEDTALGQVLQDGGQPAGGVLELMDYDTWVKFNENFLRQKGQKNS
jgi:glycine cleavage system H protein